MCYSPARLNPEGNMADKADPGQHARFLETARAIGCNEEEAAFDEKLKGLARQKSKEIKDAQHTKRDDE